MNNSLRNGELSINYDNVVEYADMPMALTKTEIEQFKAEVAVPGDRAGGIGLVRIMGTMNVNWVWVRGNDFIMPQCPRHPERDMRLMQCVNNTRYNLPGAYYMKCFEMIGGRDSNGMPKVCGFNIYPCYSGAKIDEELLLPEGNRPYMIEDLDRLKEALKPR
jgi:hypothetical protein